MGRTYIESRQKKERTRLRAEGFDIPNPQVLRASMMREKIIAEVEAGIESGDLKPTIKDGLQALRDKEAAEQRATAKDIANWFARLMVGVQQPHPGLRNVTPVDLPMLEAGPPAERDAEGG